MFLLRRADATDTPHLDASFRVGAPPASPPVSAGQAMLMNCRLARPSDTTDPRVVAERVRVTEPAARAPTLASSFAGDDTILCRVSQVSSFPDGRWDRRIASRGPRG